MSKLRGLSEPKYDQLFGPLNATENGEQDRLVSNTAEDFGCAASGQLPAVSSPRDHT